MRKHLPADDYMFLRCLSLLVFAGSETPVLLKPSGRREKKQTSECFTRVKKMHRERGGREQMPVCEAQSHTLQQRFKAVTSRGHFVRIITPPTPPTHQAARLPLPPSPPAAWTRSSNDVGFRWCHKESMKSYYSARWTLTHMSTFCLHNNSVVRVVRVVRVGARGRVKGCQVGRTCHLLRVLGSWFKGEDARGRSRRLCLFPSASISSSLGSKWSVAWTTQHHLRPSSASPASLIRAEVFISQLRGRCRGCTSRRWVHF